MIARIQKQARRIFIDNWKPKYICLVFAILIWGLVKYQMKDDQIMQGDDDIIFSK